MPMNREGSVDPRLAELRDGLERELLADIPLARAMQLRVHGYDGQRIHLRAPLAPNSNDKGCAFGGSLASLMTLAGWGLTRLQLQQQGHDAIDIYVRDSKVRYLQPVWGEIDVFACAAADGGLTDAAGSLARFGRVRSNVHCQVELPDGTPAATLDGCFVAIARPGRTAAGADA